MRRHLAIGLRKLRRHPIALVLGALASTALVIGSLNFFFEVGPEPAGAEPPVATSSTGVLACGVAQPAVGAEIDHLAPPPGHRVAGPESPEAALAEFLSVRFPSLDANEFEETEHGSVASFVLDSTSNRRVAEMTVSKTEAGIWQVTSFDMCNSLYEQEVRR